MSANHTPGPWQLETDVGPCVFGAAEEILQSRDAERRRKRGLMGVGVCGELGT